MRKTLILAFVLVFLAVAYFVGNMAVAQGFDLQLTDGVEIVKRHGVLYVRGETGCWWMRVGALDKYPVEWTSAGGYLTKYVNNSPDKNKQICHQSSIWVVADTARKTRPVYRSRKKVGNINIGARCFEFVRQSSFDRQYRVVDFPGGGYALCEVKFVYLLSGAIN